MVPCMDHRKLEKKRGDGIQQGYHWGIRVYGLGYSERWRRVLESAASADAERCPPTRAHHGLKIPRLPRANLAPEDGAILATSVQNAYIAKGDWELGGKLQSVMIDVRRLSLLQRTSWIAQGRQTWQANSPSCYLTG